MASSIVSALPPTWQPTTTMPGPRLTASAASASRRDVMDRLRRESTPPRVSRTPTPLYQRTSSGWAATPSRQVPRGRRSPHSTVPPPRSSRIRRPAMAAAASTTTTRKTAKIQAASSASVSLIPGPAAASSSGPLACSPQQCPGVFHLGRLLLRRHRGGALQRGIQLRLDGAGVHRGGQLGLAGQDRHPVVRDRQEAAAPRGQHVLAGAGGLPACLGVDDADEAALGQDPEHRAMAGQDAEVPVQGLGDHHPGAPGPDLPVRCDQLYPKRHRATSLARPAPGLGPALPVRVPAPARDARISHWRSSSWALRSTSSIPPVMKNACSGMESYLPAATALNEAMVSLSGTNTPGWPVNCSATNMGCDRNRSIRRARLTVTWSSSDSSSMPRMAMMSCSSL